MAMAPPAAYGNMPTIRCTNCSAEIDIARAGDHICGNAMQPMDRFNNAFSSMKTNNNIPHPFKPRPPPSRIDAGIANRPYYPSPLSPHLTMAPPQSPFRLPPRSKTASPRPPPLRPPSLDLPLPQECAFPPFPLPNKAPVPKPGSQRKKERSPELPPLHAPLEPQHHLELPASLRPATGDDKRDTASTYSVSHDSNPHSRSSSTYRPMTAGSDSTRKASFSSTRSPPDLFLANERVPPMPFFPDRMANASPGPIESPRLPFGDSPEERSLDPYEHLPPAPPPPIDSPPRSLGHFRKPSQSAATRPLHEIGSTKTHRPTLSRGVSPARLDVDFAHTRSASALSNRSDMRLHDAPPVPGMATVQIEDVNAPYREGNEAWPPKIGGGPQLPYNPYRDLHTHHSPTESMSSNGSARHTQSSRSSPPTSASSFDPIKDQYGADDGKSYHDFSRDQYIPNYMNAPASPPQSDRDSNETETPPAIPPVSPRRKQSTSQFPPRSQSRRVPPPQPFGTEPQFAPPESQQPRLPQLDIQQGQYPPPESQHAQLPPLDMREPTLPPLDMQAPPTGPSGDLPQPRRRPAKSFSRPNYARPVGVVEPESPMDPAMLGSRLAPIDTSGYSPSRTGFSDGQQQPLSAPPMRVGNEFAESLRSPMTTPATNYGNGLGDIPHPPASAPPTRTGPTVPPPQSTGFSFEERPPQPLRRATTGARGNCRGCSEPIKGKSVSSADGRLTGRWHKQCFVCKTCQQAFPTGDFYVFGNQPYCSRHYHELNRTLCANCDRGIEGQYVETDRRVKFHPHCFSCMECHLILRDNYYEDTAGKILCEKHAFNNNNMLGPGRRFPERRTTRLMMMS